MTPMVSPASHRAPRGAANRGDLARARGALAEWPAVVDPCDLPKCLDGRLHKHEDKNLRRCWSS